MRGAKQPTLNKVVSIHDIPHVFFGRHRHSLHVIHRMIPHLMPSVPDHLKQIGITRDIVTDTKKRSFHLVVIEYIENPRSNLRNGTVIESEIYGLFISRYTPNRLGKQHAIKKRGLLYKHNKYITEKRERSGKVFFRHLSRKECLLFILE